MTTATNFINSDMKKMRAEDHYPRLAIPLTLCISVFLLILDCS